MSVHSAREADTGEDVSAGSSPIRVSAIVTTCNRPSQAANALSSILAQSRPPDEIIVVDDGSKVSFALPEGPEFRHIRVIRSGGGCGACAARNLGAQAASGEVLMFLDDDDTWEPKKVGSQLSVLLDDPEAVVVYTGRLVVKRHDRSRVVYRIPAKASGRLFKEMLTRNIIGTTSCAAIRTTAFRQVGGFDEGLPAIHDHDLWIRLSSIGKVVPDGGYNTRYTLWSNDAVSISNGPLHRHRAAVQRLLTKYESDFNGLTFLARRKALASMMFSLIRNARLHNWVDAAQLAAKAFALYPNPKFLLILLPEKFLEPIRGMFSSARSGRSTR